MTANGYTGNPPGSGGGGGGAVDSVNGRTGAVTLSKTDVQLANVDNTSDLSKPVSTLTATALGLKADASTVAASLALKAPLASPTFTGTVSGVSKAMVGLANVDNTADVSKPVSTAQQTALNLKADTTTVSSALALKADLASPALTGNPTAPTQTAGDNSTRLATTAYVATAVAGGGGGGGTAATFARGAVSTGDVTPGATGAFTAVAGLTLAIPAVVGDDVSLTMSCLLNQTSADFFEMVVLVGGSIVRYSSTGTGTTTPAGEGDPSLYPINGGVIKATTAHFSFTAVSGDISGGNVTFALAFKGSAAGKVFASANFPFRWVARNDH